MALMHQENQVGSTGADGAAEPGDYVVEPADYAFDEVAGGKLDGADTVVINAEAYSQTGGYGADEDLAGLEPAFYDEAETAVVEDYAAPIADADEAGGRDSIDWPTVAVAAGMAGIVSALVLAIAVVGLLFSDAAAGNRVAAAPQVVNLGAAVPAPVAAAVAPPAAAPPAAEPSHTEQMPAGQAPAAAPEVGSESAPAAAAPVESADAGAAAAPSLAQFRADLAVLRSGASNQEKGRLLEGGAPAAATLTRVLDYGKQFEPMGMGYRLVGPVKQSGTTATARLELFAPGYPSNHLTMKFVWKDGRWKLTDKSVCELASFAQLPCNVR